MDTFTATWQDLGIPIRSGPTLARWIQGADCPYSKTETPGQSFIQAE